MFVTIKITHYFSSYIWSVKLSSPLNSDLQSRLAEVTYIPYVGKINNMHKRRKKENKTFSCAIPPPPALTLGVNSGADMKSSLPFQFPQGFISPIYLFICWKVHLIWVLCIIFFLTFKDYILGQFSIGAVNNCIYISKKEEKKKNNLQCDL